MEVVTRKETVSGDGAPMSIYVAEPKAAGTYPVVIVFMEAFGVNGHIKKLTERFAAEGYFAVSPDVYYRQGRDLVMGYDEISKIMPVMQSIYDTQSNADLRIVIDFIKGQKKARADRIGTTGYCMGGTLSWMAGCLNKDVKASAVYYSGGLITKQTNTRRPVSPHAYAEVLSAPVLGCFGEEDRNPPAADVREVDALLTKLNKVHDFKIYPGAGHGFFCEERPSFQKAAADDAWTRTMAWFTKYLKA